MSTKPNIAIDQYLDPKKFLKDIYIELKASQEGMSFERFSDFLGFGFNSYSHQIISGRVKISKKASEKICQAIPLRGSAKKYFRTLCQYYYANNQIEKDSALKDLLKLRMDFVETDLDKAQIEYFGQWYHPVVRELVTLPDFSDDPEWISQRIHPSITIKAATESFALLQKIGYIEFNETKKRWQHTSQVIKTPAEIQSLVITRLHQHMINLAKQSITNSPASQRDLGALTMSLSRTQFEDLKARLIEFRNQINKNDSNETDECEVFQLNMQLFPLSRRHK